MPQAWYLEVAGETTYVPMIGKARTRLYPARLVFEKRAKTGKFTAMELKRPMILFKAVNAAACQLTESEAE